MFLDRRTDITAEPRFLLETIDLNAILLPLQQNQLLNAFTSQNTSDPCLNLYQPNQQLFHVIDRIHFLLSLASIEVIIKLILLGILSELGSTNLVLFILVKYDVVYTASYFIQSSTVSKLGHFLCLAWNILLIVNVKRDCAILGNGILDKHALHR